MVYSEALFTRLEWDIWCHQNTAVFTQRLSQGFLPRCPFCSISNLQVSGLFMTCIWVWCLNKDRSVSKLLRLTYGTH